MEDLNRFLPRVWTGEEYYYPIFSELGITYENLNKEIDYENIKDLNWVFKWCFGRFTRDNINKIQYIRNKDDNIEWVYKLEQCTGQQDKNSKIIYENDIVQRKDFADKFIYIVKYNKDKCIYKLENIKEKDKSSILSLYVSSNCIEVIGNVNENKELLNG